MQITTTKKTRINYESYLETFKNSSRKVTPEVYAKLRTWVKENAQHLFENHYVVTIFILHNYNIGFYDDNEIRIKATDKRSYWYDNRNDL